IIAFPQSAGQLFSWYILLHSVYIISTELSSPACIISVVILSSAGDFLFFRLPTAASTSSLSMSSICSCLLQGGISCNIILSTGLVSLYSFSKYSFHLFLISVLLSSSFPSLSFIAAVLVLALPQISFTIWYNLLVSCFFALSSASWHFPSSHCSLHCFAVFLYLVLVCYTFFCFLRYVFCCFHHPPLVAHPQHLLRNPWLLLLSFLGSQYLLCHFCVYGSDVFPGLFDTVPLLLLLCLLPFTLQQSAVFSSHQVIIQSFYIKFFP